MKKIYIALLTAFVSVSCGDFDEDINVDPNNPSEASATQLITNASIALQDVSHTLSGQFLAQYLSETEYQEASLYPVTSTSFYGFYQGPLMNLQTVLDNSMGTENQQAVAKILKAFIYWHITDRWGDIPYSEALKGTDRLTPAYDTQELIYTNLFDLLDEAKAQITPGNIADDIIYDGDMDKWHKLANSIQLLMALRLLEADPGKGEAKFQAALTSGVMTSNDDSFVFEHLNDENNQSYWFSQIDNDLGLGREWWALSGTLVDNMEPFNDPRLPVFGRPNGSSQYSGLVFGTEGFVDKSTISLLGTAIWEQDAPVYLITYPQILFAQAEAAKHGWIGGGDLEAEVNYNEAIENSLLQWTGSTADFATFIAEPGILYNPATALEQIGTQRYVHLFMNGYEAWAEWRRTGYPDNLVAPGGTPVPTRQKYTETEQFNNAENYTTAVQRQFNGEDGLYGHVWWDQ
jgi:hypothetical protein